MRGLNVRARAQGGAPVVVAFGGGGVWNVAGGVCDDYTAWFVNS